MDSFEAHVAQLIVEAFSGRKAMREFARQNPERNASGVDGIQRELAVLGVEGPM